MSRWSDPTTVTADVVLPGSRDVRASLDGPDDADACVVACPPHPQHGGSRSDGRLKAVADALAERGIVCLRFDYGPWDEGCGESTDARAALRWSVDRYDHVGLFGYSFGATVALAVAADPPPAVGALCAVSALAPPASIDALDSLAAVQEIEAPLQVLHGERDQTVDWEPVVDAARGFGADVLALSGDHFFVGSEARIGEAVADFLVGHCSR